MDQSGSLGANWHQGRHLAPTGGHRRSSLVRPNVASPGSATGNEGASVTTERNNASTPKRLLYQGLPTASRKRLKVAFACDPCRERKVRCDGAKPVCISCKRKQYTPARCVYTSESAKMAKTNEYINTLIERINLLEGTSDESASAARSAGDRELSEQSSQLEPESESDEFLEASNSLRRHQSAGSINAQTSLTKRGRHSDREGSFAQAPSQISMIDAMGTISTTSETIPSPEGDFYGTSSAVSFLNEMRETLLRHSENKQSLPPQRATPDVRGQVANFAPGPSNCMSRLSLEQLSLPPRALADHLLSCYWNRVHCLYPFVHRQSFQTLYQALWLPGSETGRTPIIQNVGLGGSKCRQSVFHCALNTMFALGCQFSEKPLAGRQVLSESFFRKSKQLLQFDILDDGDLALVQTFLIVAQYLQSTQSPSRCWTVVGMACRLAQGLGLYLNDSDLHLSALEREMRRRTWHGCVLLDMVVSMTLGRPALTSSESDVLLPVAIDDEYLESDTPSHEQPAGIFSRINFFVHAIKLYQIMGRILTNVYRPWINVTNQHERNNDMLKGSSIAMVLEIDAQLADWESKIPDQLHWTQRGRNPVDEVTERQSNVLRARFLHLKILLYRPIFNQVCSRSRSELHLGCTSSNSFDGERRDLTESVLYSSIRLRCSISCVTAAQELVNAIDISSQSTATGAWWYNMFYLFTSAIVLLLADICPLKPGDSQPSTTNASWLQCLEILDRLDNAAARECAKTLRKVRQQVSSVRKMPQNQRDSGSNGQSRNTDNMESQYSQDPRVNEAQHAPQDLLTSDFLFDDEQLRDILWQDGGIFAPGNVNDGWWTSNNMEPTEHATYEF